jgi:hypothetical protein
MKKGERGKRARMGQWEGGGARVGKKEGKK